MALFIQKYVFYAKLNASAEIIDIIHCDQYDEILIK